MQVGGQTTKGHDGLGRIASIATGTLQSAAYTFDALGNLASRQDLAAGQGFQSFAPRPAAGAKAEVGRRHGLWR